MRKYEKYSIMVEYLNGEKENINLLGINTGSFKNILSVYHRIKKTYAEKVKTIDFVGVSSDGSIQVMWTKEIKPQGRQDLKQDINDIMANMSKEMLLIKNKNFYSFNMIDALTKKENIILHEIEDIHNLKFKNELDKNNEKIRLFNKLEDIRIEKRWHKDQLFLINKLSTEKIGGENINFTHLSNVFKVKHIKPIMKPLNMKVAKELKLYEEVVIKDQEKQILHLQKSYSRVVINPVENKLICYNKAK